MRPEARPNEKRRCAPVKTGRAAALHHQEIGRLLTEGALPPAAAGGAIGVIAGRAVIHRDGLGRGFDGPIGGRGFGRGGLGRLRGRGRDIGLGFASGLGPFGFAQDRLLATRALGLGRGCVRFCGGRISRGCFGVGGGLGQFVGGALSDRLGRGDRRWYMWMPALASALLIPVS
ncbi:MAG: hypothetical protein U9R77_09620, partial [Pseudomonadota bacterium]|nr:hypothetical protein [Pseudomonadota bacterium]